MKKIAIVGGNAKATVLSGGGSAALKPSFFVTPYEGIVSALQKVAPNVEITYSEGARGQCLRARRDISIFMATAICSIHADADSRERDIHGGRQARLDWLLPLA